MTWADGPLLGLDLETDGLDLHYARPVSWGLIYGDEGRIIRARSALVDIRREIPEEVSRIHGITTAHIRERGGDFEKAIAGICGELLATSFARTPIVGANLRFDLTILDSCYRLFSGGSGLREDGWNGLVVDVMVIDRHKDKFRKGGRKLIDLCRHYGVVLDKRDEHTAKGDAIAALEIAKKQAAKWKDIGGIDIELLHVQQVAWRRQQMLDLSEYFKSQGKPGLDDSEGDWPMEGDRETHVLDPDWKPPAICKKNADCVLKDLHDGDCEVGF